MRDSPVIGVIGNPNCGKTTLFNALTGARQRIGNWPGVTVERKVGFYTFEGIEYDLVDLPGTYSLDVSEFEVSIDERIARDFVAAREADLIVNIVDASNLERNLYLTAQLREMGVPALAALNMMDVAEAHGTEIDIAELSRRLECPVVPIVASTGKGVTALKAAIRDAVREPQATCLRIPHDATIERCVSDLIPLVERQAGVRGVDPRWLALRLLEGDSLARDIAGPEAETRVNDLRAAAEAELGDDLDIALADARYGLVNGIVGATVRRGRRVSATISDRIDRVVLDRLLGIPIFLAAMYLMFMFTIKIGGSLVDAFDIVGGAVFVDGFAALLGAAGAPQWLTVLLADGIGGGIRVVATFVPVIGFLFLALSALEDSGYMARAAFVMDRFLRGIGLPGKAFVPLIVGFGCTVPAVMSTRTLEHQRDRLITIAMAPFMSCGARLPVYALFAAAFFTAHGQYVVFGLYLIGIAVAVLTGLVLKSTLLRGPITPFLMELPPYRRPTLKGVSLRTWDRTRSFAIRAGRVIVPMVLVLNLLNTVGTDGTFGNDNGDRSVLSAIGRTVSPLFSPFGVTERNWPASVGIVTGVLAKEAVVGTLDSLYSALGEKPQAAATARKAAPFDLFGEIGRGLATIPVNLAEAFGSWLDPLGLDIADVADREAAAANQAVKVGTFGAMNERFDGGAGAFAYLLFVLLYMPCIAATAAVRRETTLRWTLFVVGWTTGIAYGGATLFYQVATFPAHPTASAIWIAVVTAVFAVTILALRMAGGKRIAIAPREPLPESVP